MCAHWIHLAENKAQWRELNDRRDGLSGSSKSGKYLERLNDYQLLKDSVPWS
jgi:phenylalanine-4-hydroxylase